MRRAILLAGACTALFGVVSACMSRPVGTTEPHTSNLYVEPVLNKAIDKIDLLFMIDNSASMGDKQRLLAEAVPQLVDRLVVPRCVNSAGAIQHRSALEEPCPSGFAPEFQAVKDIHIAVITSSLGAHGSANPAGGCADKPPGNDRSLLLPTVRTASALASYNNTGFLAWDPEQKLTPPGQANSATLGDDFGDMVRAAGEDGCGYEASLESWYRFLIDPEPPQAVIVDETLRTVTTPVDKELLAQRAAFLRPDSLVAIVMLTDENDCSIRDDGNARFVAADVRASQMPRATAACASDPNDKCCTTCDGADVEGCPPIATDSSCVKGTYLSDDEDKASLRCFENKRRFGIDYLYPTSRYIEGLTQDLVRRRSDGQMVENPLFVAAPGKERRPKDLVYLAGIVGVPWQDVADDESRSGAGLRYLTAAELTAKKRWDVIVGDRSQNLAPSDPFMQESVAPRTGINPIIGVDITPATSTDPRANPINGHEHALGTGGDLQFACTFELSAPPSCPSGDCDCSNALTDGLNSPLCQPPAGGAASTTQYFGKAYPGLRPLEVLKGIGDSAIVASICPKVLARGEPGYGYEPAVDAIVDRMKIALNGRCPPRPLAVAAEGDGALPCVVVEALEGGDSCGCTAPGRSPASAEARAMIVQQLRDRKTCDAAGSPKCDSYCFCEIAQAEGASLNACLNEVAEVGGSSAPGYCYLDPFGSPPVGNAELVKDCGSSKRLIRFVGENTPTTGATAYIACLGATLH